MNNPFRTAAGVGTSPPPDAATIWADRLIGRYGPGLRYYGYDNRELIRGSAAYVAALRLYEHLDATQRDDLLKLGYIAVTKRRWWGRLIQYRLHPTTAPEQWRWVGPRQTGFWRRRYRLGFMGELSGVSTLPWPDILLAHLWWVQASEWKWYMTACHHAY